MEKQGDFTLTGRLASVMTRRERESLLSRATFPTAFARSRDALSHALPRMGELELIGFFVRLTQLWQGGKVEGQAEIERCFGEAIRPQLANQLEPPSCQGKMLSLWASRTSFPDASSSFEINSRDLIFFFKTFLPMRKRC